MSKDVTAASSLFATTETHSPHDTPTTPGEGTQELPRERPGGDDKQLELVEDRGGADEEAQEEKAEAGGQG